MATDEESPRDRPPHSEGKSTAVKDGKVVELHDWNGPQDPENPFNFSKSYKWTLTLTVCFISILTGMCPRLFNLSITGANNMSGLPAGSYGAGNEYMSKRFHVQNEPFPNLYWATTSFNLGASVLPLLFVPLTEHAGRMPGYFIAYIVFEIFLFPCAFAQNFATLVVARLFNGAASSTSIILVGGSISDVWLGDRARSAPMSLFGFTSVIGIALGPFVGSAIQTIYKVDPWRWYESNSFPEARGVFC
jgi:MFS family permease